MKFAKLWGEDDQVLVKIDEGDQGPELAIYFNPTNLGICNFSLKFTDKDKDKAWEKCEKAFEQMDEQTARSLVARAIADLGLSPSPPTAG